MSPVRPVRRRLISTRLTRRREHTSSTTTNKKTDAFTSVPIIMALAADAAPMHIHVANMG